MKRSEEFISRRLLQPWMKLTCVAGAETLSNSRQSKNSCYICEGGSALVIH